jgi:hypothetical protein
VGGTPVDWGQVLQDCSLEALISEVARRQIKKPPGRPRDPETIITDVEAYHLLTKLMLQSGKGMRESAEHLSARLKKEGTNIPKKTLANKYMKVRRIVGAESDASYRDSLRIIK